MQIEPGCATVVLKFQRAGMGMMLSRGISYKGIRAFEWRRSNIKVARERATETYSLPLNPKMFDISSLLNV